MKKDKRKKKAKKQLSPRAWKVCVFLIHPNWLYLPLFEQERKLLLIDYPSAVNQRDRKQPAAKQTNKAAVEVPRAADIMVPRGK